MMHELDNKIIEQAREGDKLAFRSIVIHYGKPVNSLAMRYTQDSEAAEDITQETFIKAFKAVAKFQFNAKFSTWLFRITTNASIDYLRKNKKLKMTESLDDSTVVSEQWTADTRSFSDQMDLGQQINKAMNGLTSMEKLAFTLKHQQGYSIQETAEQLNINNNACKQTIYRAVQKLRKQLTPMVST